ncbi:MAG TPA: protein kinase [Polyangiaceae bacterium]|nr:protein kinase [Polyangiaceae bacterium]
MRASCLLSTERGKLRPEVAISPSLPALTPRYELEGQIGSGTHGVVYRARDRQTQTTVAVKLLRDLLDVDPDAWSEEARLLTRLAHPTIVRVFDHGLSHDGRPFIAMEWLEGEDLGRRQARAPLSMIAALKLMLELARGLHAAHTAGVVHRDIKPANIFLTYPTPDAAPAPKLLDFGAAAPFASLAASDGFIVGTPAYMAPEQVRGDMSVDYRSDVYSLGATLYELVAGHPPHQGPNTLATLARLATTHARRLTDLKPEVPPALDELVHAMLSLEARDRPSDMRAVEEGIEAVIGTITRGSIVDIEPRSGRVGSGASRLLTTLVASRFPSREMRDRLLANVLGRGTEAVPLGSDSLVVHLGARRALGNEAESALKMGHRLAQAGAAVGVATGRAFIPILDDGRPVHAIGEVVDRATTLSRLGRQRELWTDLSTQELVRERFEFLPGPNGFCRVGERKNLSAMRAAIQTPFVGREAELARIALVQTRALKDSKAVVVLLYGPPGIGKSRLQQEAMTRLSNKTSLQHHITQHSEAYGARRALGVALDVMRGLLGLNKSSDEQAITVAISQKVGEGLDEQLTSRIPLFAQLLGQQQLAPDQDTRGLRDLVWLFMTQSFLHELLKGPVAIVTEDLQWADPESVAWLDHLMARAANLPLLLMVTARHEFRIQHADRFTTRDHVALELHPVSSEVTRRIAANAAARQLSSEALETIVQQAGGSPLFAEELTRLAVVGARVSQAPTIEAAIQVSLDALVAEQRRALAYFSVLGQTGWDDALEYLGVDDPESPLEELEHAGILMPEPGSRFVGMREWQFKHALVRDVVYQSLAEDERRHLHGRAAEWFSRIGEDPALIARHFDLAEQPGRAADFWAAAAKRALSTNALRDALAMAERALTFADNRPAAFTRARLLDEAWSRLDARASDRETAVCALEEHVFDEASQTYALGARARYDAVRGQGFDIDQRLADARDEARRLGLRDEEAKSSAELAVRLAFAGDFEAAEQEAAQLLELSEAHSLGAAAVEAWQALAIVRQSKGELSLALQARRSAVAAARSAELRERESVLTTNLGFALTTLGVREEARELLLGGLELAEAIGSQGARRHAHMLLLCWCAAFGHDRELDGVLTELRAEADAAADGTWTAPARENLGALFYRGLELLNNYGHPQRERARALLQLAAQAYQNTGNRDLLPVALGFWAKAEQSLGARERAFELATRAAELLKSGAPSLLNESPVYLVLHDVELGRGNQLQARRAIVEAMTPLLRRVQGLLQTPYARPFLTGLSDNSQLVALADGYGVLPREVHQQLTRDNH